MIEAFKSTLEEARQADLLIHVVDASHAEYKIQYDTVNEIVQELDMQDIPQVVIFNKRLIYRYNHACHTVSICICLIKK